MCMYIYDLMHAACHRIDAYIDISAVVYTRLTAGYRRSLPDRSDRYRKAI
jgi:hypothetical protein